MKMLSGLFGRLAGGVLSAKVYWVAIALLFAALGAQQLRVSALQVDVATAGTALAVAKADRAEETTGRMGVALDRIVALSRLLAEHNSKQQEKDKTYAEAIKKLEAVNSAGRDTARGLRNDIAAYVAASGGRPGEADAAVIERYRDRLRLLGELLGQGVDLVVEGQGVVGQRDAEVGRLLGQIQIDRWACQSTPGVGAPAP
jgi:hypothetical protein